MEGLLDLPAAKVQPPRRAPEWPGYLAAGAVAALAFGAHELPGLHLISTAILAMAGGILARNLITLPAPVVTGIKRVARTVIPVTIVLSGAGLDLSKIAAVGMTALAITLICIAIATLTATGTGRLLKVWPKTAMLIGAGTAICGTSAIVAVAPLIEAADEDLMLSIGTINILGLLLMFALPAIGAALHMSDQRFGVWAGVSIHAVPQVVAAAFAFSPAAGALATLVKLVRVTMLAPFLFVLGIVRARNLGTKSKVNYAGLIPKFVWGFLILAGLSTLGLLPVLQFRFGAYPLARLLTNLGEYLLTLSMAALGMEVNIRFFAQVGGTALLTGLIACLTLCLGSLLLIYLLL